MIAAILCLSIGFVQARLPVSPFKHALGQLPHLRLLLQQGDSYVGWQDFSSAFGDDIRVFEMPEGWNDCGTDSAVWQFERLAVEPNPPQRNKNVTVRVIGTLLQDIQEGFIRVEYLVKYGALPIVRDSIDPCEAAKDYPMLPQCPLKAGRYDVSYSELIPFATPMGTYTIRAEGFIPDGEDKRRVFCVEGVVPIKLFNPKPEEPPKPEAFHFHDLQ